MTEEISLRVAEAYHKDVGRGIARIDTHLMQEMGLVSGDIIEISGRSKTYAIVWPNVERGQENKDQNRRKPAKQCKSWN
jgi:transitional endoplasmic reticulum ATPase